MFRLGGSLWGGGEESLAFLGSRARADCCSVRRSLLALVYFSVSKINSIEYRNVLKNPSIRIDARGGEAKFQAAPISDDKAVKSVVETRAQELTLENKPVLA